MMIWLWLWYDIKILESLRITKEYILDKNKIIEPVTSENISIVLALALVILKQAVTLKSIVSDLKWFKWKIAITSVE